MVCFVALATRANRKTVRRNNARASQPYFLRARMRVVISKWSHARAYASKDAAPREFLGDLNAVFCSCAVAIRVDSAFLTSVHAHTR